MFLKLDNSFFKHNDFFSFFAIFITLFFFYAPIDPNSNTYAFISRVLRLFSDNENYIGYTDSIRWIWIRYPLYYFFNFFGFELGFKISCTLILIFYSYTLFHFSRSFNFSIISIISGLIIFFFFKQSYYFGTEVLFGEISLKVFAYNFIILSFSHLQRGNFLTSIMFAVFTIYSHFLIGYFWVGVICLFYFFKKKKIKDVLKYFGMIFFISLPVLSVLIYENYIISNEIVEIDYNKIFLIRHDNLVNPFNENGSIKVKWYLGYIKVFFIILILLAFKKKINNFLSKELFFLLILINLYFYFISIVIYLDKSFVLAKFIPFRPEALTFLLSIIYIFELGFIIFYNFKFKNKIVTIVITTLVTVSPILLDNKYNLINGINIFFQRGYYIFNSFNKSIYENFDENEKKLLNWVSNKTNKEDVIVFEDGIFYSDIKEKEVKKFTKSDKYKISSLLSSAWEVISQRPAYVNNDVIGGTISSTVIWSKRMNEKENIYNGNCEIIKNTPIKYIISIKQESKIKLIQCLKKNPIIIGRFNVFAI